MIPVRIIQPIVEKYRPILRYSPLLCTRFLKRHKSSKENELATSSRTEIDTNVKPLGKKVKETTKTVSYLGVILLGVGVTGTLFYAIFRELFSSKSPNNVYTKAVKKCIADPRVEDKLGKPITAYGEETRRGRRQHVSHVEYVGRDDKRHLRMKFHLKGSFHTGTVQLDVVENESSEYEYRYLFVEVDDMLRNTIVIEDNRHKTMHSKDHPSLDIKFY